MKLHNAILNVLRLYCSDIISCLYKCILSPSVMPMAVIFIKMNRHPCCMIVLIRMLFSLYFSYIFIPHPTICTSNAWRYYTSSLDWYTKVFIVLSYIPITEICFTKIKETYVLCLLDLVSSCP